MLSFTPFRVVIVSSDESFVPIVYAPTQGEPYRYLISNTYPHIG